MNTKILDVIDFFLKSSWFWEFPQWLLKTTNKEGCSSDYSCNPNGIDEWQYNPVDKKW